MFGVVSSGDEEGERRSCSPAVNRVDVWLSLEGLRVVLVALGTCRSSSRGGVRDCPKPMDIA